MTVNYEQGLQLLQEARTELGEQAASFRLLLDIQAGVVRGIEANFSRMVWDAECTPLQDRIRNVLAPICDRAGIECDIKPPFAVMHPIDHPPIF